MKLRDCGRVTGNSDVTRLGKGSRPIRESSRPDFKSKLPSAITFTSGPGYDNVIAPRGSHRSCNFSQSGEEIFSVHWEWPDGDIQTIPGQVWLTLLNRKGAYFIGAK